MDALINALLPVIGVALTALIGLATATFTKKTGIELEEKYRIFLHEAAMNGVRWALGKIGWKPGEAIDKAQVVQLATQYVAANNPKTLKHFGIDPDGMTLPAIISTKLPDVNPETVPATDAVKARIPQAGDNVVVA